MRIQKKALIKSNIKNFLKLFYSVYIFFFIIQDHKFQKLKDGFKITDAFKTTWTIGKPIGQGTLGQIYLGWY